jgi:hypothetical protein
MDDCYFKRNANDPKAVAIMNQLAAEEELVGVCRGEGVVGTGSGPDLRVSSMLYVRQRVLETALGG